MHFITLRIQLHTCMQYVMRTAQISTSGHLSIQVRTNIIHDAVYCIRHVRSNCYELQPFCKTTRITCPTFARCPAYVRLGLQPGRGTCVTYFLHYVHRANAYMRIMWFAVHADRAGCINYARCNFVTYLRFIAYA
jgi:hypothetical protein